MRVLHITNAYPVDSRPTYGIFIKEQIDSLKKLGVDIDVYFVNVRQKGKKEFIKSFFDLIKRVNSYDIVHCHHSYMGFLVFTKKPLVTSFLCPPGREGKTNRFLNIKKWIYRFAAYKATTCIIKDGKITNKKEIYLPNGVNMDLFYPMERRFAVNKLSLDESKSYVLFCSGGGVDRYEKRYGLYKQVVAKLKERFANVEELVVTNVDRADMPLYFNAASVMLLTSFYEGSPNAVKEAMACNLPVVSSNVGDVHYLLENVSHSYIVKESCPEKYFKYICKIFESNLVSSNGRQKIYEKRIDSESIAMRIQQIYCNIHANN